MTEEAFIRIRDDLEVSREALEAVVRRYRIRRLGLFGSAARGDFGADSDIDLLVEFEPGEAPSLWREPEIREAFSQVFGGRRVDLVPSSVLDNPFRRRAILQDLKVLVDEAA